MSETLTDRWLESQAFYDLLQAYRLAPPEQQSAVVGCFEAVKQAIRDHVARAELDVAPDLPASFVDLDLHTASETLSWDIMLAIGALSAVRNALLNDLAQRLHDARPLLVGLIALGRMHPTTLVRLVELGRGLQKR